MIEEGKKSGKTLILIIILNVLAYVVTSYENFFIETSSYWINIFGFIPSLIGDYRNIYRILTSMFIHADIFHIFFNMYYLYLFGRPVIESMTSKKFITLYLFSGLMASIFHTAFSYTGGLTSYIIPAVGASGAISGVLGVYLILYPGTYLTMYSPYIFFPFPIRFRVRAEYYLIFWFATQVLYGYAKIAGTTAVFAHAGGFLAGIAILPLIFKHKEEKWSEGIYTIMRYIEPRRTEGIGRTSKAILTILITILIIGNIYALINPITGEIKSMMIKYNVDGEQYMDYTAVKLPNIESYIRDVAVDETRILLNRLAGMNILYNPLNKGIEVTIRDESRNIPVRVIVGTISRVYTVKVNIEYIHVVYDEDGFISYCEGLMETQLIIIQGYAVYITNDMLTYSFTISTQTINLKHTTEYMQLPSALTSIIALIVILKKSDELTLISEKMRMPRLPIPI
ncbi:MAG: rhomboid family intramembrane serine protease [Candidatus Methanomethylicia archaeon]